MDNQLIIAANQSRELIEYDDDAHVSAEPKVSEIVLNENASLELYVLQNVSNEASIRREFKVRQMADSRLKIVVITFNGGDIRNTYHVDLDGEGAETQVHGLYLIDKTQHVENRLKVNHNVPHCTSSEKFKGILDDEATAIFNGHVYVAKNAQKTDAQQNNSNILLTSKAKINSQPFLEIYADDVKCSHGSTMGQLNDAALFYMQQRGISREEALLLLQTAFVNEVIDQMQLAPLRDRLHYLVDKRFRGELSKCEGCQLCK